ncbi:hypothetical protein M5K25_020713 [Dendrobium thyrsiflorum]|uniref:Uncharacterized protein n=1 Tax=Dendrobium thyrsiflorum TaxID=117978 RepID=A0ABD0UBF7_DENTH
MLRRSTNTVHLHNTALRGKRALRSKMMMYGHYEIVPDQYNMGTPRITISEIKKHPWFLKNLPRELTEIAQAVYYKRDNSAPTYSLQSVEDIMTIVKQARNPPSSITPVPGWAEEEDEEEETKDNKLDEEEEEEEDEEEEEEDEYAKHVKEVQASGEYEII